MSYRQMDLCGEPGFRAKHRYRSRAAARKKMVAINSGGQARITAVYWCRRCSGYHLTSQEQR